MPAVSSDTSENTRSSTPRQAATTVAWAALFALFVVPALLGAIETARHFNGSAIDGPFQLYNALRRIAAGFRPGVDFQFFHGLGVPYAHYWLFRLLGGRFQDSELSRELISTVLFPLVLLVFFRGFVPGWRRVLCLSATAMAVVYLLRLPALLFALNSMVGLRSTLPVLVPVVLYRMRPSGRRVVALGLMLGLALFFSTEQGLAAVAAFVVISAIAAARGPSRRTSAAQALATLALAVVVLLAALMSVAGVRGAFGALRYNFRLVPMDQYWFFGAPPNPFIDSWADAVRMSAANHMIGAALLLGAIAAVWYGVLLWRARDDDRRASALAFLAIYGLVSCASLLGVFVPVYAQPCWRTLILLGVLELSRVTASAPAASDTRPERATLGVPRGMAAVSLVLSAWVVLSNPAIVGNWFLVLPDALIDPGTALRYTAGGIWPATLRADDAILAAHRSPTGAPPSVWSTYAGWAEARNGSFNPSFDYIIHALGPGNRRDYVDTFQRSRPALVQTVSPLYTPYEAWIENTSWDFYHALLGHYVVAAETPWSIFWEPRDDSLPAPVLEANIPVAAGQPAVQLPAVPTTSGHWPVTLLEVEIEYRTHNPLRVLPIVGAAPRYLVQIDGALTKLPVTLDPYVATMRFPLLARPGQTPRLRASTFSLLPGASVTVTNVRVFAVPLDARDEPWLRAVAIRAGF